jgi:TetR/AcrR family tetracycline transcriptional repressor
MQQIVQAALRVLDRDGYAGLGMRAVAEELGVKSASLYWHIADKHELLDALADALLGEIALPGSTPRASWQDSVRADLRAVRAALLRRRDAGFVLAGRFPLGPHGLRLADHLLGQLASAGFDTDTAAAAAFTLGSYAIGFVTAETQPMTAAEAAGADSQQLLAAIREQLRHLPPKQYPHLVSAADAFSAPGMDHRYEFGLSCLLEGLTATLTKQRAHGQYRKHSRVASSASCPRREEG